MKPAVPVDPSFEIELKLSLPTSDPASLAKRLTRVPVLARRKPAHQHLHTVYYDTPDHILRRKCISLRIRRVGSDASPQWIQTLKTGDRGDSALSQRGEWESPVPSGSLALDVLKATPWADVDPQGKVFEALMPAFLMTFERTSWMVRQRNGSKIVVALDIGQIVAGEKSTRICELELELLSGQSAALFELARPIAANIAVLPTNLSKAERGYALAQGCLDIPLHAQAPKLTKDMSVPGAAGRVLREMFCQFTANLNALRHSDDPEVVHQARVGWRRFRSALRLFKPALVADAVPSWQGLELLLTPMGELRDLDVARVNTLPPLAHAYTAGDAELTKTWQATSQALMEATQLQRKTVRYALHEPAVGANLLAISQWLEALCGQDTPGDTGVEFKESLRRWSKRRIERLHRQLKVARRDADTPERLHRVRILAKRLRYGIEALGRFLPKRAANRWYQQATRLQLSLGAARDVMQADALLAKLGADRGLVEFIRGVAVERASLR